MYKLCCIYSMSIHSPCFECMSSSSCEADSMLLLLFHFTRLSLAHITTSPTRARRMVASSFHDTVLTTSLDFRATPDSVSNLTSLELAVASSRPDLDLLTRQRAYALFTVRRSIYEATADERAPRDAERTCPSCSLKSPQRRVLQVYSQDLISPCSTVRCRFSHTLG